jgi:hypothetical protein
MRAFLCATASAGRFLFERHAFLRTLKVDPTTRPESALWWAWVLVNFPQVVHNDAGLLAAATPNQYIKVFNIEGELLNQMKHHTNFLGEAIGPNSCMAFHPLKSVCSSIVVLLFVV